MILPGEPFSSTNIASSAMAGAEQRTLLKTISNETRATKLAELANGYANNGCGRSGMQLARVAAYYPSEQAYLTTRD